MAATQLVRRQSKPPDGTKNTYLGAQYLRLRRRRGPAKATTAVGHSILVAAHHMLYDGVTYNEVGPTGSTGYYAVGRRGRGRRSRRREQSDRPMSAG